MAAKDFGLYRDSAGLTALGGGDPWKVLQMDPADIVVEEAAFSLEPTTGQHVLANDEAPILFFFGSQFTGSSSRTTAVRLMVDRDGGSGYEEITRTHATYTNDSSLDRGVAFGVAIDNPTAAGTHKYQVQARGANTGESTTEVAGSTFLQCLRMPKGFHYCILTHINTQTITTTFAPLTWGTEQRVDAGFSIDTTAGLGKGITVPATDRYLALYSVPTHLDTDPAGSTSDGGIFRVRFTVNNSSVPNYCMARRVVLQKVHPGAESNQCMLLMLDLTAGDVVRVEAIVGNLGDFNNVAHTAAPMVCAMVQIGSTADAFSLSLTADVTSIHATTTDIAWDSNDELDTGSFAHSTTVNPSRVTLPTAKVLLFCKLGSLWPTPGVPSAAFDLYWRTATTTDVPYGAGGTNVNMGDAGPEPNQNQADMVMGLLMDAAGEVIETRVEEIGTGADANFEVSGGSGNPGGSVFWGINIDDWPGEDLYVSLDEDVHVDEERSQHHGVSLDTDVHVDETRDPARFMALDEDVHVDEERSQHHGVSEDADININENIGQHHPKYVSVDEDVWVTEGRGGIDGLVVTLDEDVWVIETLDTLEGTMELVEDRGETARGGSEMGGNASGGSERGAQGHEGKIT